MSSSGILPRGSGLDPWPNDALNVYDAHSDATGRQLARELTASRRPGGEGPRFSVFRRSQWVCGRCRAGGH